MHEHKLKEAFTKTFFAQHYNSPPQKDHIKQPL